MSLGSTEIAALVVSFKVASLSVAISLPVAVGLSYLLARGRFVGRFALDALVHLPLVLPPVVVGYLLLLLLGIRAPLGAWLYHRFGLRLPFTLAGAALATAIVSLPLMVRSMRLALEGLDPGLDDVARTLGAHALDRFVSVTLPLMLPGILAGAVTAFVASLGEFGAVITFAGNIPGETQTLPLALYSELETPGGEPAAARLALLSIALGTAGLLLAEWLARALRRTLGS
jgi:molybdate transport system permease protein